MDMLASTPTQQIHQVKSLLEKCCAGTHREKAKVVLDIYVGAPRYFMSYSLHCWGSKNPPETRKAYVTASRNNRNAAKACTAAPVRTMPLPWTTWQPFPPSNTRIRMC